MVKNTYQSYTEQTPIIGYRSDFMRRGAMCSALAPRHPGLAAVSAEAKTIVAAIDSRLAALQDAEDKQLLADALEDVEKLDVVELYTEMRRTMFAKKYEVTTLLPDAPSSLGRLGADVFTKRAEIAIANLKALPNSDPMRNVFLANLEQELSEYQSANNAEDVARDGLKTIRLALTLYKSELAQTREAQLGTILTILKDREKTALFTLPWRKSSRTPEESPAPAPTTTP